MKVQEGKFKLQDLLVVPMQRVLKYHLLLKVGGVSYLNKYTTQFIHKHLRSICECLAALFLFSVVIY